MKKYKADKYVYIFLFVISILVFICIISNIIYYLYLMLEHFKVTEYIREVIVFVLVTAYAAFVFVILPLWLHSLCFTVSSKEIMICSGVVVKRKIYIPLRNIQYTTMLGSTILSKINFNFLLIETYSGRIIMPFLSLHDMEEINKIIQKL